MPLLERSGPRAELSRALAGLVKGQGAVVLVSGEAGIGKTSLLRAFLDDLSGIRVLTGGCDDLLVPRPLGAIAEAAAGVPGLAERLAGGVDAARVVREAFGSEATVCVVEDVHWADEATLDVLTHLVRRVGGLPLLLVLSYRDDELPADHPLRRTLAAVPPGRGRRIGLAPLSLDAVRRLAGPEVDADALHGLTGGNPFFVSELLSSGGPGTPGHVRDAVLGRFGRLQPRARETAELVSVVPGRTEGWLVRAVLGDDADVAACVAQGLLVSEDADVRFRHELARRAVEEELSGLRRQELNRRVLHVLAARPDMDSRATHHAARAGDPGAVVRHGLAAADQAVKARAHREAAELLTRVLEHEDRLEPSRRADVLDTCATESYNAGRTARAATMCERALALRRGLGDPRRTSDTLRRLSRIRWYRGDRVAAQAAGEEAIALLDGGPACPELAKALSNLAQLAMPTQRDDALLLGRRAGEVARAIGDAETVVHAQVNVGTALARSDVEAGVAMLDEAAAAAAEHGFDESACRALVNAAWMLMDQRRTAEAVAFADRAEAVAVERELDIYQKYAHAIRGLLALSSGAFDEALREVALASRDQTPTLYVRGVVAMRRGDPESDRWLVEGRRMATSTGELQRVRPMACAWAERAWLRGDARGVDEATAAGFALALERRTGWDVGELAVWRARAGLLHDVPEPCAAPYALEIAGDPAAAADRWRALGMPYDEALALLAVDDAAAVERAIAVLDGLGATATLGLARSRLRALGVSSVPRGRRPTTRANPAGLTDRQVQVLDLMAQGLSNREIASRLVIFAKTVEHHVGAVLRKLGVHTREQAATLRRTRWPT